MPVRSRYAPHQRHVAPPTLTEKLKKEVKSVKEAIAPHKPKLSTTPQPPSLTERLRKKAQDVKESISPTPKQDTTEEQKPQKPKLNERRIRKLMEEKIKSESSKPTPTPPEEAREQMARRMAGEAPDTIKKDAPHKMTRAERREINKQRHAEQQEVKYGKSAKPERKQRAEPEPEKTFTQKVKEEVSAGAKQVAGEIKEVFSERAPQVQKGIDETEKDIEKSYKVDPEYGGKQKTDLAGRPGDKWRVDPNNGDLYAEGKDGKWYPTGKKTKFKIPETIVDTETGFKASVHEPTTPSYSTGDTMSIIGGSGVLRPEIGSGTSRRRESRDESLFSSSADKFSSRPLSSGGSKQSFGAGMEYMSAGMGYKMWDESKERSRLDRDKQTSTNVSSSYLGTGSPTSWDESREREKLSSFKRQGSPLSAGLGYLSAGGYSGSKTPNGIGGDNGSGLLKSISSGTFGLKYGAPRQQPAPQNFASPAPNVSQEPAPSVKMTRAEKKAENKRNWELQQMQKKQTPSMPEPMPQTMMPPQQPMMEPTQRKQTASELLFGAKPARNIQEPLKSSAVNSFFGMTTKMMPRNQQLQTPNQVIPQVRRNIAQAGQQVRQKPKTATELLFGKR
jgi:hypothetical protein